MTVQLGGHGLPCVTGRECSSELRILRAASTHFPTLRSFLRAVYDAFRSHKATTSIDEALRNGDFVHLMSAAGIDGYDTLFDTQIESTGDDNADDSGVIASEPKPVKLELALRIKHAKIISLYDKAVLDFAQHPCCSCNRLFQEKAGTVVRFSDKIGTMWGMLKQHILKEDPQAARKKLFMCTYCKTAMRRNDMSPRCVLNSAHTSRVGKVGLLEPPVCPKGQGIPNCCPARYVHPQGTHIQFPQGVQGYHVLSSIAFGENNGNSGRG